MNMILEDDERAILNDVRPWIIGSEGADKNFAPIFKDNTPTEILEEYERFKRLVEIRKWRYE